ncbi:MAG TPA: hypothetical protein VKB26_12755 [Candidatus Acidoferrales bacterium]|nr:hypothetical protein [Candidatus Acidoferrales bacterium]
MTYAIGIGILALIVIGIAKAASGRHYEDMTEEGFEAEAKRGSSMGSAIGSLQKIIDSAHSTEHMIEQEQRLEADRTNSGDRPRPGSPPKT